VSGAGCAGVAPGGAAGGAACAEASAAEVMIKPNTEAEGAKRHKEQTLI